MNIMTGTALDNTLSNRRKNVSHRKPLKQHEVRLTPLRYHKVQAAGWVSPYRFNVVPAGRRSGKTEIFGKRKLINLAYQPSIYPDGARIGAAAPTRDQAKRIFWRDLKLMVNNDFLDGRPSESDLMFRLKNKNEVWVLGLDKPERAEGTPWDHLCVDEIGNTKPQVWEENLRPALSDRRGTADLIGVPEGRNHYYKLFKKAKNPRFKNWGLFHWFSSDILDADEIAEAKEDLDIKVYQQEYEGSFISFGGMAYYNWSEILHVDNVYDDHYNPIDTMSLAFDFNRSPGVCVMIQELQEYEGNIPIIGKTITAAMDQVYIPTDSNSEMVCEKVIKQWGKHEGEVHLYGDSTGGNKGTAKLQGSDWDIVTRRLRKHFGAARIRVKVPRANPPERSRVNAMNSRLLNANGDSHFVVDGENCEEIVDDFEGVRVKDGVGEIDKKRDKLLSHLSDAIGYYVIFNFPIDDWEPLRIIQV